MLKKKNINQACCYVLDKIKLDNNKRNAVIYGSRAKSIKSVLEKILPASYVSWGEIDDKKISIITA